MEASELRELLTRHNLTQRGAAGMLNINERTMRRYCAGIPIPVVVELALRYLCERPASKQEVLSCHEKEVGEGHLNDFETGFRAAERFHNIGDEHDY